MGKWHEGPILAPPENKNETLNPGFFFIFLLTALYTVTTKVEEEVNLIAQHTSSSKVVKLCREAFKQEFP